jgi:SAM-dependent methyltransferase
MPASNHTDYLAYLKTRSLLGLTYRRFFLYPRLSKLLVGKTLDVGCGIGDFLAYRPNTMGCDINPHLVAYCQSLQLNAVLMQPDSIPFDNEYFDSVILDNVLEHIHEPAALILEIRRVLRPNGRLLIGVPGQRGYASDPDHKVFYTETSLIELLKHHSFLATEIFHSPVRSNWMNSKLRQYCIYCSFEKAV